MTMMSWLGMEPALLTLFATRRGFVLCSNFAVISRRKAGADMSRFAAGSRERPLLTGRRVLIVEDEYFLADDMGSAFRSLGADIAGPVGDIDDALRMLHDGGVIDGAVLDVNIRKQMIYPVARELRARGVPIVFTSGYDRIVISNEFADVALWEKPLDHRAMARSLAGMILRA
ncbi:CheY-like chemotaxis protein [Bradyrhizobium sp. USDA 4454]